MKKDLETRIATESTQGDGMQKHIGAQMDHVQKRLAALETGGTTGDTKARQDDGSWKPHHIILGGLVNKLQREQLEAQARRWWNNLERATKETTLPPYHGQDLPTLWWRRT